MTWKRIRLELARGPGFPEGSHRHGYEMTLPVQPDGQLDKVAYHKTPELCTVHRFWAGEEDRIGDLVHTGANWLVSFPGMREGVERLVHFMQHRFVEGEYVGLREPDGREHTFKVVKAEPAPGLPVS